MNKNYDNINCPVEITLDVIGGKWKVIIIYHLQDGIKRFGELKKSVNGITQKMLTQQLRELEADGIINRKVYAQVPPKVEYSLTDYGYTLKPILALMCQWGSNHKRLTAGDSSPSCVESEPQALSG